MTDFQRLARLRGDKCEAVCAIEYEESSKMCQATPALAHATGEVPVPR
jgi:hypothetical protein